MYSWPCHGFKLTNSISHVYLDSKAYLEALTDSGLAAFLTDLEAFQKG